jgi:ABC-type Co2+ transport system permease subunit
MIIPPFTWLALVILIVCVLLLQHQGRAFTRMRAFQLALIGSLVAVIVFGNWAAHAGIWRVSIGATSRFFVPFLSLEELVLWLSAALLTILLFEHLSRKKDR